MVTSHYSIFLTKSFSKSDTRIQVKTSLCGMKQDTLLSAALPAIFGACAGSTVGSTLEKGEFSVKDGALKTVSSISLLWHTPEKFSDTAVRIVACLHRALSVTPRPHRSYARALAVPPDLQVSRGRFQFDQCATLQRTRDSS